MKDVRSRKGFIRCPKSMIIIGEVSWRPHWNTNNCPYYLNPGVKELLKCNGLFNVCDISDMDILTIPEKYVDNCNAHSKARVCIVFDCIHGMY